MKYLIFFTGLFFFLSLAFGNTPQKVFAALDCTDKPEGVICDQWTGPNYCCAPPDCVCNTQYTVYCFGELCVYDAASQSTVQHDTSWDDCCPTPTPTPVPGASPTPTPTPGGPTPTSPPSDCGDSGGECCSGSKECCGDQLGDFGKLGCSSTSRCCEQGKCKSKCVEGEVTAWLSATVFRTTGAADTYKVETDEPCSSLLEVDVSPGDEIHFDVYGWIRNVTVSSLNSEEKPVKGSVSFFDENNQPTIFYHGWKDSKEKGTADAPVELINVNINNPGQKATYVGASQMRSECGFDDVKCPDPSLDRCKNKSPQWSCLSDGGRCDGEKAKDGTCCDNDRDAGCYITINNKLEKCWTKFADSEHSYDSEDYFWIPPHQGRLLRIRDQGAGKSFYVEGDFDAESIDSEDTQKIKFKIGAPSLTPTPTPYCEVLLEPDPLEVVMGETGTLWANVFQLLNGVVTKVAFLLSANLGTPANFVSLSPAEDSSSPFSTTVTGKKLGEGTITGDVYVDDSLTRTCWDEAAIKVIPPPPWFQTQEGDVHATTNLSSFIPQACVNLGPPGCVPYFSLLGSTGYPGVVSYGGTAFFDHGSVSQKPPFGWLANSAAQGQFWDYFYPLLHKPTADNFNGNLSDITADGIYYSANDVTISNDWDFPTNRKAVVLIDGKLTINKTITVPQGSFLAFITSGNIEIRGTVGEKPGQLGFDVPDIEGVYVSDNAINTNYDNDNSGKHLLASGIFVAKSFVLGRDLKADDNATIPAEKFIYRVDLLMNSHQDLWKTKHEWQELPP